MADGLSIQRFRSWIPSREALRRIEAAVGDEAARRAIQERLKAGLIGSATELLIDELVRWQDDPSDSKEYAVAEIGRSAWYHLRNTEDFWQTGDAEFLQVKEGGGKRDRVIRCFNVRFKPADIRKMIPREPRDPSHEGGRPRLAYWDDLWIEICRQLFHGELKPKKQVDIENAMLAWAAKHGHEMSVASARTRARASFAALKRKTRVRVPR